MLSLLAVGCSVLPDIRRYQDPLSAREHINLGVSYERSGEIDLAIDQYELAAKELPIAHFYLGNAWVVREDLRRAEKHYSRALEKTEDPDPTGDPADQETRSIRTQAMNNLAWVLYLEDRDLDRARALAREAVRREPEDPSFRDTLTSIEERLSARRP